MELLHHLANCHHEWDAVYAFLGTHWPSLAPYLRRRHLSRVEKRA